MCAACVAQGAVYAGGALAGLQVMAARARRGRGSRSARDGDRALDNDDAAPTHDHVPSGHDRDTVESLQGIRP
jgi:hypothetical protein